MPEGGGLQSQVTTCGMPEGGGLQSQVTTCGGLQSQVTTCGMPEGGGLQFQVTICIRHRCALWHARGWGPPIPSYHMYTTPDTRYVCIQS